MWHWLVMAGLAFAAAGWVLGAALERSRLAEARRRASEGMRENTACMRLLLEAVAQIRVELGALEQVDHDMLRRVEDLRAEVDRVDEQMGLPGELRARLEGLERLQWPAPNIQWFPWRGEGEG